MLLRIFYKQQWYTPFLLAITGLALWQRALINPSDSLEYVGENIGPLFDRMIPFFHDHPTAAILITFVLMMFQAFFITHLASSKVLKNRFSAITGLIFILLTSSRPFMLAPQAGYFAGVFILLAFNKILNTYAPKDVILQIFNAGLLISLAGLFYFPAWSFFILLIISLAIYFVISFRTVIAALTGFITPLFFLFVILWVSGQLEGFTTSFSQYQDNWLSPDFSFTRYDRIYLYILGFLTILSLFSLRMLHMPAKVIVVRKRMLTLSVALVVAVLSYAVAGKHLLVNQSLLIIPLSVALAVFFEDLDRRILAESLFLLTAIILAAGHLLV